jgi:hypothetical protein
MTIGYDNLPMLYGTVLDIPMFEGVGTLAHDISRAPATALDKTMTLTGPPTWANWPLSNIPILSFNPATPDFLELAAAESTDMDFQVGAFSVAAWIYVDDLSANRMLFCRGLLDTDGWHMAILINGSVAFYTNQAAANQVSISTAGDIAIAGWYFVGATRLTTSIRLYVNAVDVTATVGVHTDPLTSARKLHIGVYDTEVASMWDGYIWRPRVWSRQISAAEMIQLFEMERGLFGV